MAEEDKKTDAKDSAGDKGTGDKDGGDKGEKDKDGGGDGGEKGEKGDDKKETIPKSRFDQVYKDKKEAEEKLEKMEKEKKDSEETKLKEEGKYKELYEEEQKKTEEVDVLKKQIENKDEVLKGHLSTLLDKIPEDKMALIPDGTPDAQLTYISKNQKFLLEEEKAPADDKKKNAGTPPPNDREGVSAIDDKKKRFAELGEKQQTEGWLSAPNMKEYLGLTRELGEIEREEKEKAGKE